jgi:hypothetical protein
MSPLHGHTTGRPLCRPENPILRMSLFMACLPI